MTSKHAPAELRDRLHEPGAVRAEFARVFDGPSQLYAAPARINLIGEHTDYNEGFVLPATVDRYTWVAAGPGLDGVLRVQFSRGEEPRAVDLGHIEPAGHGEPIEYVKAVAWALQEEDVPVAGCDLVVGGNIPLGGGLSSSASLEVVLAWALLERSGARLERDRVARVCHRAEAGFVGMPCGVMDQFAVALGRAGCALHLDCRSLVHESVPMPPQARFLLVHSGVSHRHQSGEYRRRRAECEEAVRVLRAGVPELGALRDLQMDALERNRALLPPTLYRRCRHVVGENLRVGHACRALREARLADLGALLDASHASLRDDYEVSCAEVDRLVEIARGQPGVLGSRMMGGGFGGCTISLVEADAAEQAAAGIADVYGELLGRRPWMHVAGPAGPVGRWVGPRSESQTSSVIF